MALYIFLFYYIYFEENIDTYDHEIHYASFLNIEIASYIISGVLLSVKFADKFNLHTYGI